MNNKTLFGPICILTLALLSSVASAAPLDKSANAKIDEAINVHYLATNFDKAEGLLKGTLKACGDRCSPSVKARAWMYVGIVRGAGQQDMDGAAAAFIEAVTLDPNVRLDVDLATPELQQLFDETTGMDTGGGGGDEITLEEIPGDSGGVAGPPTGGAMTCTPEVAEVETRRAIPVACQTQEPAARTVLYYKEFGAGSWSKKNMGKSGDSWLATIPCSATGIQGLLSWYVVASNAQGQPVDSYGAEVAPVEVSLVPSTAVPPPAYPGKAPPERCVDMAECPVEMRGTPACPGTGGQEEGGGGGWGDSCRENGDCSMDLACIDGTCESPPSCETDADCSGGTCVDFVCAYDDGGSSSAPGDGPTQLIGIQIGIDMAQMSGEAICNPAAGSEFQCYLGDQPYAVPQFREDGLGNVLTDPNGFPITSTFHSPVLTDGVTPNPSFDPLQSGAIGSSLAPSTIRALLTYERLLTENVGVEGRAGMAFSGAPSSGFADLLHLAVRGKYWFTGTGPGLRLFGLLGGGIGQVDAKKAITVAEFGGAEVPGGFPPDNSVNYTTYCNPQTQPTCLLPVTAYKSLGTAFVTGGIGAFLNLGGHGPSAEINARIMFPESGFVIQPTAGWLLGF